VSESKHTPGPWTVGKSDAGFSIYAGDLLIVDLVSGITDDEADANASLIGAAPDLLEALHQIDLLDEIVHDPHTDEWRDSYRATQQAVAAAIAKAERWKRRRSSAPRRPAGVS
jgi:hypothetical protein